MEINVFRSYDGMERLTESIFPFNTNGLYFELPGIQYGPRASFSQTKAKSCKEIHTTQEPTKWTSLGTRNTYMIS